MQRAVEVRPLIHETYGGLHRTASRPLREMAGVYAARQAGSAGGRRARTFRSFHRQRISCAVAKGLAFELRRRHAGPPRAWRRRRQRVSARRLLCALGRAAAWVRRCWCCDDAWGAGIG